jgi:NAD(P)-dependent dehydrogenase (short-subunit alcohol dehydrogenase family)
MPEHDLRLDGKCVLVTGASAGLGRATAKLLSERGAQVVAVGRDQARLDATRAELVGEGHVVAAFDLNQTERIVDFVTKIAAETKPLAGIVHAAGIQRPKPLRTTRPDDFLDHFRTNALAAAMLLAAVSRRGVADPQGCSVVLVGSVMSQLGAAGLTAYCSSKAALVGLVRAAALELAPSRIRVNAVLPGVVESDMSRQLLETLGKEHAERVRSMHPLGTGQPADVASAVAYLVSDAARWVTGTSLVIDGGYSAQ